MVTIAAVVAPLIVVWMVCGTRLRFLFERPGAFKLKAEAAADPAAG